MPSHVVYYIHILPKEAGSMAEYGRNILKGAACEQMATLLDCVCGFFGGKLAVKGIAMPFWPACRSL